MDIITKKNAQNIHQNPFLMIDLTISIIFEEYLLPLSPFNCKISTRNIHFLISLSIVNYLFEIELDNRVVIPLN